MYGPKPLIPLKALKRIKINHFFPLFEQSGATPPSTRKGSMLGRSTESFQAEQKQLYNIPSKPEKAGAGSQKDSPAGNVSKAWWAQNNLSLLGCLAWSRDRFPIFSPLFLTQQMVLNVFPFSSLDSSCTHICLYQEKFKSIEDV